MKVKIKKVIQFLLNPKFLLCFGIAWLITNGWSYILLGIGTYFGIGWMVALAGGYLTLLWLPISPEKIVTVAIAIALLKVLFPNDKRTLAVLVNMKNAVLDKIRSGKNKREKNKIDDNLKGEENEQQ